MRIYVAGPYSADSDAERHANVDAAIAVGVALVRKGHAPFIPHLSHYVDEWALRRTGSRLPYEAYLAWDDAWLDRSDALYFIGPSPGATIECQRAHRLGLPVYTHVDDVPTVTPDHATGAEPMDDAEAEDHDG